MISKTYLLCVLLYLCVYANVQAEMCTEIPGSTCHRTEVLFLCGNPKLSCECWDLNQILMILTIQPLQLCESHLSSGVWLSTSLPCISVNVLSGNEFYAIHTTRNMNLRCLILFIKITGIFYVMITII